MRRCSAVRCHAERSSALSNEGLRQMAACRSSHAFSDAQQRWQSAQEASEQLQQQALDQLSVQTTHVLRSVERERASCLAQVSALAGARDTTMVVADAERAGVSGNAAVEELLQQLRVEPLAEEECAAKFKLYETFLSQVEKTRLNLVEFYEESAPTVPPAVAVFMSTKVKAIDSQESMGIPEDACKWFVYYMMSQASRNNGTMANVLRDFEKKLELLANQAETDCPVCLEPFQVDGDHIAETLGCCHKVCKQCWSHWTRVMNGSAFCPLCRHDEFVNILGQSQ